MVDEFHYIEKLISKGQIKAAIERLMKLVEKSSDGDLELELLILSNRFNQLETKSRRGIINAADYNLENNKIVYSLLEVLKEHRYAKSSKQIFMSYSHRDQEIVQELKAGLEQHHISVVIDADKMHGGEDIRDFIVRSLTETDVTLSIVSKHSLLSDWVAIETINSFHFSKIQKDKKFIACYLDDSFLKREFTLQAIDKIDASIQQIEQLISRSAKKKIDTADLNKEKTRYYDLRSNMDKIIAKLRNSLCIDIRGDMLQKNLPKIIESIQA